MASESKPSVLVFIVAYNAEKTIREVVFRIPRGLLSTYEVDVLIIDDSSRDATFEKGHSVSNDPALPFPITVLFNPKNQGYGGNQKLGYHYALEHGYDFVALIHGDGQYAPECLPELLEPLRKGEAAAVFGSRMLTPSGARQGGMPLYKFAGNRILTWLENRLLRHEPERVPFRLPYLLDQGARGNSLRPELERLPFRHRDHHSVADRGPAHQRTADSDLLRRRDLLRERHEVRVQRGRGRTESPAAGSGALLRPQIRLRARRTRCPTFPSSLTPARIRSPSNVSAPAPASSISDAPAGIWALILPQQKQCRVDGIDAFPHRAARFRIVLSP